MVSTSRTERMSSRSASERGASEVLILLFLTILLGFAGVAYDAGMAFNARRQATNYASAGARAGANVVDRNELYSTGRAILDDDSLVEAGVRRVVPSAIAKITAISPSSDRTEVYVQVELKHQNAFLSAFGVDEFVMVGEGTAQVSNGTS